MVYVYGIVGFITGFVLGQALLMIWLKGYSNREIMTNRQIKYRYGLFNWGLAVLGAYVGIRFYDLVLVAPG